MNATTRVLVTGGTGRTGAALVRLVESDPAFDVVTLTHREAPRDHNGVTWVRGDLARPLVHEADLADVALLALWGDPDIAGRSPRLTGPAAVTQREQVEQIGAELRRDLRFVEVGPDVVREQLVGVGWPPATAVGAHAGWRAMAAHPETVHDVTWFTGRPGRSFARWANDHVDDFR